MTSPTQLETNYLQSLCLTGGQGETDGFMSNTDNGSDKGRRSSTNPGQLSVVYSLGVLSLCCGLLKRTRSPCQLENRALTSRSQMAAVFSVFT